MRKKFKGILFSGVILCLMTNMLSCSNQNKETSSSNELEKMGFSYDGNKDWYIKSGEQSSDVLIDGTFINFTMSDPKLDRSIIVNSNMKRLVLIGKSNITYSNVYIEVSARNSDLYIEFRNFNFSAPDNSVGIDCTSLTDQVALYIISTGTDSITGGQGSNGENGKSYGTTNFVKNASNGETGKTGLDGFAAIKGNNICLDVTEFSNLTITGGQGGNGGNGGNGQGSKSDGIAQAGHGGIGGQGGQGGNAIECDGKLNIKNNGKLTITGGQGGNGGNGGNGGENGDTGAFDRADHGGNGGAGGRGGNGGYGISFEESQDNVVNESSSLPVITGGNGGDGGQGGNGGSSCKNEFQTSNGGNPGSAGNGGNGGDGNLSCFNCDLEAKKVGGTGGQGGKRGVPGYSPNIGNGYEGSDGNNGNNC